MSHFVLRLTHLKEVKEDQQYTKILLAFIGNVDVTKYFLGRALDTFDNVYYVSAIRLRNGHGVAIYHCPDLGRFRAQALPLIEEFFDEGLLVVHHPPLCTSCWRTEHDVGKLINHFRQHLTGEKTLPLLPRDAQPSEGLLVAYETVAPEEIVSSIKNVDSAMDILLHKSGGHN